MLSEAAQRLRHELISRAVERGVNDLEVVGHAGDLANEIQSRTGIDSRATVLGHVQRGGSPTLRDRVTASRMGYHAIELLARGIYNRVVATRAESIVDYDISVALSMYKTIDTSLLDIATAISI